MEMSWEDLLAFFTSSLSGLPWQVLKSVEPVDIRLLQPELVGSVLVIYFLSLGKWQFLYLVKKSALTLMVDVSEVQSMAPE